MFASRVSLEFGQHELILAILRTLCDFNFSVRIGKIPLTSPIVINVPTRASLAVETKDLVPVVGTFD